MLQADFRATTRVCRSHAHTRQNRARNARSAKYLIRKRNALVAMDRQACPAVRRHEPSASTRSPLSAYLVDENGTLLPPQRTDTRNTADKNHPKKPTFGAALRALLALPILSGSATIP